MKILTFTVPCYNSQNYMRKCINGLLAGGEDVEIIIVDDGSTDNTPQIADEYALQYPSIIKVVHQENGGHGSGLNTGLEHANGIYFKVIDSDDWVDPKAYQQILKLLKAMVDSNEDLDLLITNYVYEKQGAKHKKIMHCRGAVPENKIFNWDDKIHFSYTQYIIMHSATFRTDILRRSGLVLPKHTFYVDNIFVFVPLPLVKKLYYLDVDFYRYYIGRDDQSVNEKIMIKRIDQQIRVNKIIIDAYNQANIDGKNLDKYMRHHLEIVMCIATTFLTLSNSKENIDKKDELWKYLKDENPILYKKIRFTPLSIGINLPGRVGRAIFIAGYRFFQKFIGFN